MDATELKEYIIKHDLCETILTDLGCHDIKSYEKEYRCALPDGHNNTAVSVKKDSLFTSVYTGDGKQMGDIFTLVMSLKHMTFGNVIKYLHKLCGVDYTYKKKEEKTKVDPLAIFKKVKRVKYNVSEPPIYDDEAIREYIKLPYIGWIREGISPVACERFNIGYSIDKHRIIIPWRYWCGDEDDYVGIIGRTTIPMYKELGIPKYFGIKPFEKGKNIYGLNENYQGIQSAGYVVVFESEKSVLKRYSRYDYTGVAIGCCEVSDVQASILIGLNVEIVLCFDEGISLQHIRKECEKFANIRKVSYIYDTDGLLAKGSKDSPADMEDVVYYKLFNHRINYNETERKKYLLGKDK